MINPHPQEWKVVELRELLTFLTSGSRGWAKFYAPEGRLFLRIQNVRNGKLLLDDIAYVNPPDSAEARRTLVQEGDILISITADLGRTAVVPKGLEAAHINQHLALVRLNQERIFPAYLSTYLSSPGGQLQFAKLNREGVKAGLNFDNIKDLQIPLPPVEEQRRIAAILDKADAVRRKRKEAIALTEELLRSAFLEMFGNPVTNPKGWEVHRLEEFSVIQSGIAKGKKVDQSKSVSVPYMRVANVQDGYIDLSEIKELEVLPSDVDKYTLKQGDLLLTEGGDPDKLGRGAVWYGEIQPCIHQNHIFCVRPNRALAEPEYLSALIGSERGKRYFLQAAKQTTGIATINKTQLCGFPALLPPLSLQQKYTELVKSIRFTRKHLNYRSEQVNQLFNSLLQHAFRGKL